MMNSVRMLSNSPANPSGPVPSFEPHPWLTNGHAQTVFGRYLANGTMRLAQRGM